MVEKHGLDIPKISEHAFITPKESFNIQQRFIEEILNCVSDLQDEVETLTKKVKSQSKILDTLKPKKERKRRVVKKT